MLIIIKYILAELRPLKALPELQSVLCYDPAPLCHEERLFLDQIPSTGPEQDLSLEAKCDETQNSSLCLNRGQLLRTERIPVQQITSVLLKHL